MFADSSSPSRDPCPSAPLLACLLALLSPALPSLDGPKQRRNVSGRGPYCGAVRCVVTASCPTCCHRPATEQWHHAAATCSAHGWGGASSLAPPLQASFHRGARRPRLPLPAFICSDSSEGPFLRVLPCLSCARFSPPPHHASKACVRAPKGCMMMMMMMTHPQCKLSCRDQQTSLRS